MPQIGEQADILRALGRALDEQKASGIQITAHETFLAVAWGQRAPGSELQAYQEHHLQTLRMKARDMRTGAGGRVQPGSLAELLRTLGQELDQGQIEASGIIQEPDGFRVSGIQGGRYFTRFFRTSELMQLSLMRRQRRGSGAASEPAAAPAAPFDDMRPGIRVFTQDGEELGVIQEISGRSFKVMDPSGQFGFWLPARSVGRVAPGQWAQLTFPRSELDRHRSWAAPMD